MFHLRRVAGLAALGLALAPAAHAHEGNPDFRSTVQSVTPDVPGLHAEVMNYDDNLQLTNRTGATVVVEGYDGEPYVRMLGDGTVEVNRRSPAAHLNEDRFAEVSVPSAADADAPPDWREVGRSGRYAWHDHRIHWMSRSVPPQVKDEDEPAHVLDWEVPVQADGRSVLITGSLEWRPESYELPAALPIGMGALTVVGLGLVVVVRRRRGRRPVDDTAKSEAW